MSFDVTQHGSGIWFVIHTLALHANTDVLKEAYIITINTLCDHFGCETCKEHFKNFINKYPLRSYWKLFYKGEDLGFFKWSWELHNIVNKVLKKQQISFDDALSKYKNYICKNCDKKVNPILVEVTKNEIKNETNDKTFNLISNY